MKLATAAVWVVGLGIFLGSMAPALAQSGPTGTFDVPVRDPGSAVWDITDIKDLTTDYSIYVSSKDTDVKIAFNRTLQQSGSGNVSGAGSVPVALTVDGGSVPTFTAQYKTTGSITSSRGQCKIKLNTSLKGKAQIQNATRQVSASDNSSITVDNALLTATGLSKGQASAEKIGSVKGTDSWTQTDLRSRIGDGSWTLGFQTLLTTGNKVTGAATATLDSGIQTTPAKTFTFGLKGTYTAKTQIAKLVLTGQGIAKGGNLVVTMGPGNKVTLIKGRIFGQMVNATFAP